MTQVKKAYVTAADEVAEKVRVAELADVSDLTVESWKQIDLQLAQSVKGIRETLEEEATEAVGNTASRITAIDQKYLTDITTVLDPVKIANMYVRVNEELISNMATRMFADGYTFSQRIWGVGDAFQGDIKQVILSGLSQGRDPVKIADDLQVYIADGKVKLMQRYGNLEAGTKEFAKRIPKNVDYRAMRLVRTEVYASLKEAGVIAGQRNPGAEDLFDWVMQSGRAHWDCECPDYAHNSPYTAAQVPVQPHPNCHPAGTKITMASGKIVPIEDVAVGDLVLSHDGTRNRVLQKFSREHSGAMFRFTTPHGTIRATGEHPLLSDGKWVETWALVADDNLTLQDGTPSPIRSVYLSRVDCMVYNMEVENVHSYIANGFASHNCGCYLVPHLRDRDEFVDDLVRWASGESVDYLDDWADRYYYPA